VGVTDDRVQPWSLSLRVLVYQLGSRTGKVATGDAAVPASRHLDEEDVERTETLTGISARRPAVAQPAFPGSYKHNRHVIQSSVNCMHEVMPMMSSFFMDLFQTYADARD